jgi:hypothetical protein
VKEDHGHPDREDELGTHAVQGVLDDAEHRGADQSSHGHQHDHLRNSQKRRDELREQTGAEYETKIPKDVLDFHALALLSYKIHEPVDERRPAKAGRDQSHELGG